MKICRSLPLLSILGFLSFSNLLFCFLSRSIKRFVLLYVKVSFQFRTNRSSLSIIQLRHKTWHRPAHWPFCRIKICLSARVSLQKAGIMGKHAVISRYVGEKLGGLVFLAFFLSIAGCYLFCPLLGNDPSQRELIVLCHS